LIVFTEFSNVSVPTLIDEQLGRPPLIGNRDDRNAPVQWAGLVSSGLYQLKRSVPM
jgi:hypothetical protein